MTLTNLGTAFELNPAIRVRRGAPLPFVEMAGITPWTRDVTSSTVRPFTAGSKFMDGDVLMARITPSLENGKTSIYRAAKAQGVVAFGSTEYIVVRGREGISDSVFAYYLLTSRAVRRFAVSQMSGSSGRQRVQLDSFSGLPIRLPALSDQKQVASDLSLLDDKIAWNRHVASLETSLAMGVLMGGSERIRVSDFAFLQKGLSYTGAGLKDSLGPGVKQMINLANFTTTGVPRMDGLKFYSGKHLARHVLSPGDLVVANTDLTQARDILGRGFIVPPRLGSALHTHHTSVVRFRNDSQLGLVLWAQLQSRQFRQRATGYATGTTVSAMPEDALLDFEIRVPSDLDSALVAANKLMAHAWHLESESVQISATRDLLREKFLDAVLAD